MRACGCTDQGWSSWIAGWSNGSVEWCGSGLTYGAIPLRQEANFSAFPSIIADPARAALLGFAGGLNARLNSELFWGTDMPCMMRALHGTSNGRNDFDVVRRQQLPLCKAMRA